MSDRIIRGITDAYSRVRAVTQERMVRLFDLMSSRDCPAQFLDGLASVVGFSPDLKLSTYIDGDDWRSVIDMAPTIWAAKGGHETYRSIILAMTQARAWIGDWFSFRTVAGTSLFPWFGTAALPVAGDWWTEIHVEDADGALDRDLAMAALDIVRPIGERLNVTFVSWVENWDNLFRWAYTGDATVATNALTLAATAVVDAQVLSDPAAGTVAWDEVFYHAILLLESAKMVSFLFRHDGAASFYQLDIDQGAGPNNIELWRNGVSVAAGTAVVASTSTTFLRVSTTSLITGALVIDVGVNGVAGIINYTDAAPLATGNVGWLASAVAGGATHEVQWFEIVPENAETRTLNA